jgi:hypothetical protein
MTLKGLPKWVVPGLQYVVGPVLVALITALTTIYVQSKDVRQARDEAENAARAARKTQELGVGMVVASMLTPIAFAQSVGDPWPFDPLKSRWSLADGEEVSGSTYQKQMSVNRVPDMRGLFLRGANYNRTDQWADLQPHDAEGRQEDTTRMPRTGFTVTSAGAHSHTVAATGAEDGWGRLEIGGPATDTMSTSTNGDHTHTLSGGDPETRPRNIAVYFYIRIN